MDKNKGKETVIAAILTSGTGTKEVQGEETDKHSRKTSE